MSRFGEYLRIKKHKGEKYTPLCPEVCARLLKNQESMKKYLESIRKNILLLLVLILSPMVCYSEIPKEIEKPLNVEVRIGYGPNHFSPTAQPTDSVKVKEMGETKEISISGSIVLGLLLAVGTYCFMCCIIFVITTLIGCIMLMIAIIIRNKQKNVNKFG